MLELLGNGIVTVLQWKYMLPLLLGTFAGGSAARCRA